MNEKYKNLDENAVIERLNKKMEKKKNARDAIMEQKTKEGGLIIVHTGKGKGKTTGSMGLAVRAIGNGMKIAIIQFIKGEWNTGEKKVLDMFPEQCKMYAMGCGFSWESQDRKKDIQMAEAAWDKACEFFDDESIDMIILDEINIALKYEQISLEKVKQKLATKRDNLHVVLTGRNAHDDIIEMANLVTEMTMIKHHFKDNYKAQLGIEY